MDANNRNIVTSPGASEPQGAATGSEQAGFRGSSSSDCRGTGVASQAPVSSHATSAVKNTEAKPDGNLLPQSMTRQQAEEKYMKLLEASICGLEGLDAAVAVATNTKLDVKNGIKTLGKSLREFARMAKVLGMTRSTDPMEKALRTLQLQQHQQHQQLIKMIEELREDNKQLRLNILTTPQGQCNETSTDTLINDLLVSKNTTEGKLEELTNAVAEIEELLQERKIPGGGSAQAYTESDVNMQKPTDQHQKKKQSLQPKSAEQRPTNRPRQKTHIVQFQETEEDQEKCIQNKPHGREECEPGMSNDRGNDWITPIRRGRSLENSSRGTTSAEALVWKRTPKTEALTITEPAECETYASVMKRVLTSVKLADIDVKVENVRRT